MVTEIKLGDTVKCLITGFQGIVTSKMEFLNGCIQYSLAPKVGKDNKLQDEICIDSQSLRVVKKGPRHKYDKEEEEEDSHISTGGPRHKLPKQRGY